ncbi:MAG: SUMF1/EgtB/PvdO family nonheme iron enzyme [Ktedonobacterales bacterium]|nr:SUMF1/EgtB/PvdO family nonheme iron enzyme [Ktedonobacterales bacterium]
MPTYQKVFISYSHIYGALIEQFKQDLRAHGITVWIDHESLTPGTLNWDNAIRIGIRAVEVVLYMASPEARQSNNVQGELDVAERESKPIIPIWIAGDHWVDAVPMAMSKMQHIDARGARYPQALQQLLASLGVNGGTAPVRPAVVPPLPPRSSYPILARLDSLGFEGLRDPKGVPYILPPVCAVPAGKFTMGSTQDDQEASDDEKPQYRIEVGAFEIGTYPVTVAEYALAVIAGAVPVPQEPSDKRFTWAEQQKRADHPVVCVTWENARDYCRWLTKMTGQLWRLPTEAEWEKAARWDAAQNHTRKYPWGDTWDKARANTSDGGPGLMTPIGLYAGKGDASPYGAHDMAGNIWEWMSTLWYDRPPYDAIQYEKDGDATSRRVLRGGSWCDGPLFSRAAYLSLNLRAVWNVIWGFRVVRGDGLVK